MVGQERLEAGARVIAAADHNHNGNPELAARMIDVAVSAGCDAVKFLDRIPEESYTREALGGPYFADVSAGRPMAEVLKSLRIDTGALQELRAACEGRIDFVLAPHGLRALEESGRVEPDAYQVDPEVLTHGALLREIARRDRPVYLVVGMCGEREISDAVEALDGVPLTLLHSVTAADVGLHQTALGTIRHLHARYDRPVGYFGLDEGVLSAVAAVALGAVVVEKRFTLDRHLPGPDHGTSLDREDLHALVANLHALGVALEVPEAREVLSVELEPFSSHRVSLVAARDLPAGTVLAASMLTAKAPQRGLSPALLPSLLGRRLLYDVSQDQPITFGVVDL